MCIYIYATHFTRAVSLTPTYIKTHKQGMSLNQTDTHTHARSLARAFTPSLSDFLLLRSLSHTPSFSLSIFSSLSVSLFFPLFLSLLCVRMRQRLYPHAPSINFILNFFYTCTVSGHCSDAYHGQELQRPTFASRGAQHHHVL